jgi:hypothetical protein
MKKKEWVASIKKNGQFPFIFCPAAPAQLRRLDGCQQRIDRTIFWYFFIDPPGDDGCCDGCGRYSDRARHARTIASKIQKSQKRETFPDEMMKPIACWVPGPISHCSKLRDTAF